MLTSNPQAVRSSRTGRANLSGHLGNESSDGTRSGIGIDSQFMVRSANLVGMVPAPTGISTQKI